MKTVVVAGGAGFIGSHLCTELLEAGCRVVCVDNLVTGARKNIAHLAAHKNFSFIKHDVRQPLKISGVVDEIYNLACPASPVHYQKDPVFTFETSVWGTRALINLALQKKARLLQASTSEIYGDPLEHPQTETYWGNVNPHGLRSCYDEGKRAAETLCFDYHRQHKLNVVVVRIFNTYGPRMATNDGRVVSNFIVQALAGKPITIYGDGKQTRSFQYVDDLVRGLRAAMAKKNFTGPVNLGNPAEFTVGELAKKVVAAVGSKSKIIFKSLPSDDPRRRKPDISLAKKMLHWSPRVPLDAGLKKTISYFVGM